uniref:MARVEL domain-containing protein n=1 Tax=Oncorhynchus tshawytscha TaxID=74940 RepID=A0AAZ3PVX9_ONCTS
MNIGSERLLCVFNKNADACNYGVTVGVVCFLGSVCFLVLDIYFPTIHSVRLRRRATLIDMVFSALASFLWFMGFCFLANQWQQTTEEELPLAQGSDAARAAVAFCFFSILTWVRDTWGGGLGVCMCVMCVCNVCVQCVCVTCIMCVCVMCVCNVCVCVMCVCVMCV